MNLKRIAFLLATLAAGNSITSCMEFRTSDQKIREQFAEADTVNPIIESYLFENRKVRYLYAAKEGADSLPLLMFVHGAPGSLDAFLPYMLNAELLQKCRMVAPDRLGYGYSEFGKAEPSIETQARSLFPLVEKYRNGQPVILVGHSYGGPVIARMAAEPSLHIDGVVFWAPANSPELEKIFWYSHLGKWKLTRWAVPASLVVAADEKFAHQQELERLLPYWQKINAKVWHVHGTDDSLVDYGNLAFTEKQLSRLSPILIPLDGTGHLFPFTKKEKMVGQLIDVLGTF